MPEFKNKPNKPIDVDGKTYFVSRSVACGVVVLLESKDHHFYVLINKRGDVTDFPYLFNLPAGYLDWGESAEECVRRELFEECGLELDNGISANVSSIGEPFMIITDPTDNPRENVVLYYGITVKLFNTELPKLSNKNCEPNEVEEIIWCSIYDLDKYEFAFHHDKRIKYYLDMVFGG